MLLCILVAECGPVRPPAVMMKGFVHLKTEQARGNQSYSKCLLHHMSLSLNRIIHLDASVFLALQVNMIANCLLAEHVQSWNIRGKIENVKVFSNFGNRLVALGLCCFQPRWREHSVNHTKLPNIAAHFIIPHTETKPWRCTVDDDRTLAGAK